ncbi:MAG: histidine phosphatase family protein [Paracoccaceae bacterium]
MGPTRRDAMTGLGLMSLGLLPGFARSEDAAWAALARPGAVAMMRHALAPGGGDPAHFRLGDCATQRNLDGRGRDQARRTGAEMRARGIAFDRVLTSQWCRCRETAELLGAGPVEELPALNSFFEARHRRRAQTDALRAYLAARDPSERLMLVTHQVNITALTGRGVASGEIFVIVPAAEGRAAVLGEILIRP